MRAPLNIATELCHSVIAPQAATVDQMGTFPQHSIDAIRRSGLLGLMLPREYGGMDASFSDYSKIMRQLGGSCASTAMIFLMHVTSVNPLVKYAEPTRRETLLESITSIGTLFTEAISEPGSGSQWWSISSTATPVLNGFHIKADKSWATTAGYADAYVVSTRAPNASSDREHALFVIDATAKGIVAGDWNGLGLAGSMSSWIKFDTFVEPDAMIFGNDPNGLRLYNEENQPLYHLGLSSVYLGIAEAAFRATLSRIRDRVYTNDAAGFGSNLRDYPSAQQHIGTVRTKLYEVEGIIRLLIEKMTDRTPFEDIAALMTAAKLTSTESAISVCNECMLACGGSSYLSNKLPVERAVRDALAGPLMGPNNDFCRSKIGRMSLSGESYHQA